MEESLAIIRRAWSEDRLTFHGKFFQIPEVVVNPNRCSVLCHRSAWRRAPRRRGSQRPLGHQLLPIHTRTPEQVEEFADAYWTGLEKHGHENEKELGLLVPMHLAKTTAHAKARAEEGIMSYFKIIADMRSGYIDWLTRRGVELPARLGKTVRACR